MKKEDMIRQILRNIEHDFFRGDRRDFDRQLSEEWRRLDEKSYSEVEELYYAWT